jgi:hypothetical protein
MSADEVLGQALSGCQGQIREVLVDEKDVSTWPHGCFFVLG